MLYRFRSPATGDLVMLGPNGDELLKILGREPAPRGIIEPADMPQAMQALQAAVAAAEALQAETGGEGGVGGDDAAGQTPRRISLRQRVWPMVEMLRRAHAAEAAVVWGV